MLGGAGLSCSRWGRECRRSSTGTIFADLRTLRLQQPQTSKDLEHHCKVKSPDACLMQTMLVDVSSGTGGEKICERTHFVLNRRHPLRQAPVKHILAL